MRARLSTLRPSPSTLLLAAGALALLTACSGAASANGAADIPEAADDTPSAAPTDTLDTASSADSDGTPDDALAPGDPADGVSEADARGPGGEDTAEPEDVAAPAYQAGDDALVVAFDKEPIYFAGEDNRRVVDKPATFPAKGTYTTITLHLTLSCPSGGCDPWDRLGSLGVVTAKGTDGAPDTVIEVARFVTPYHVGMSADLDVSDLRPLLQGEVTLRAFIDTWVGPGSPYGDGWLLSASFDFVGGVPANVPLAVLPVYTARGVTYGDPAKPIASTAPPTSVTLPPGTQHVTLRSLITGHGQGNASNCAEFCSRKHAYVVGDTRYEATVWRDDCATTAAPNQQGTYKYARAGWCPGAAVTPWIALVSEAIDGDTATVAYDVEEYTNSCRPGAEPCSGCTLGTGCDYDGGGHTEPYFQVSTVLVAFD